MSWFKHKPPKYPPHKDFPNKNPTPENNQPSK